MLSLPFVILLMYISLSFSILEKIHKGAISMTCMQQQRTVVFEPFTPSVFYYSVC